MTSTIYHTATDMNARLTLAELLEVVANTYRAIDLRTAAVQQEGAWVSVFTVARLTHEDPKEVADRVEQLEKLHGKVRTERFRIVHEVRPYSEWENFCTECLAGTLQVTDAHVSLGQEIELRGQAGYLSRYPYEIRHVGEWPWPTLEIVVRGRPLNLSDERLARELGAAGFPLIFEVISTLCEANFSPSHSQEQTFVVAAPVCALISGAEIQPKHNRLRLKVVRHEQLSGLQVTAFVAQQDEYGNTKPKARHLLTFLGEIDRQNQLETVTACADLMHLQRTDKVDVMISHPRIGPVYKFSGEVKALLPKAQRNVLFEALKLFCCEAELVQLAASPQAKQPGQLKPSAAFELRVAWLLGLLGLPTILLGKYETLKVPGTEIIRGSVDVVATTQKNDALFLVACTLGAPEEADFNNLLNVRGILEQEVFADTTVRIMPVVFTAARGCPPYREFEGIFNYIPIIDAAGLESLVELLRAGQERRFFEFLANPTMNELPKVSKE